MVFIDPACAAAFQPRARVMAAATGGGGFGRRANPASDYIVEAVQIAKDAKVPVEN